MQIIHYIFSGIDKKLHASTTEYGECILCTYNN